jgi:hypothetical protein
MQMIKTTIDFSRDVKAARWVPYRAGFMLLGLVGFFFSNAAKADPTIDKDPQPVHPGTVCYTVTSDYQKGPNKLEVLLPDKVEPGRKYPVLYVLPVNTGTDGNWGSGLVELQKLDVQNRYGVIVVAPAYDVEPWYGDMPKPTDPSQPWIRQQAYITDVVIPFIDKEFPTETEKGRYLITFSKGGFGGLGLLLRNPGIFYKSAVDDCADPMPSTVIFNTWGIVASYGTLANFDENFNLLRLLHDDKVAKAFTGNDRRVILIAGSPSYGGVNMVRQGLDDSKIPYAYMVFPGMGHSWNAGWLSPAVNAMLPIPSSTPPPAPAPAANP